MTATLPFNGDDIRRSGLNGPYTLTNLTIADQQYAGVPAVWQAQNVWTTAAYIANDFAATCFVLTNYAAIGGTISANLTPDCNEGWQYTSGTVVTLTATANTGYAFTNWDRDATGPNNPITVTIDSDKLIVANFSVPLTGVVINGPTSGIVSAAYIFTATVSPITATVPITYVWEATGQTPVTNTASLTLTDTITFTWSTPGPKTITVTAANGAGMVSDSHVITLAEFRLYLPLVRR